MLGPMRVAVFLTRALYVRLRYRMRQSAAWGMGLAGRRGRRTLLLFNNNN